MENLKKKIQDKQESQNVVKKKKSRTCNYNECKPNAPVKRQRLPDYCNIQPYNVYQRYN